jgi:hypothetical protein
MYAKIWMPKAPPEIYYTTETRARVWGHGIAADIDVEDAPEIEARKGFNVKHLVELSTPGRGFLYVVTKPVDGRAWLPGGGNPVTVEKLPLADLKLTASTLFGETTLFVRRCYRLVRA